jgi:hypothetical protein
MNDDASGWTELSVGAIINSELLIFLVPLTEDTDPVLGSRWTLAAFLDDLAERRRLGLKKLSFSRDRTTKSQESNDE